MRKSSGDSRATFVVNGHGTAGVPLHNTAFNSNGHGTHQPPHHSLLPLTTHSPPITHSHSQPVKEECISPLSRSHLSHLQNPLQTEPSASSTTSPPKKEAKVLKRANTSSIFAKKESFAEKDKKVQELNLELEREKLRLMQQDLMNQQTKAQIQKFDKTIQSRRKIFGNPILAKEEKVKRRQHHLQLLQAQKEKKKSLHKLDSTDEFSITELQPFPSVTTIITSSTTSNLITEEPLKKYSNRREIQSPFGSKAHHPLTIYGTKHFYEENYDNEKNESQEIDGQASGGRKTPVCGEDGFLDEDEDEDDDIFASSEHTDDPSSPMSFKRSGTFKFMDDLLRADSRSTLLEPSLSMAETAPYDGNPNVANYFGEEARKRFFFLYNRQVMDIFLFLIFHSLSKKFEMGHGAKADGSLSVIGSRRQSTLRPETADPTNRRKSTLQAAELKRPFSAKPRLIEEDEEDRDDPLDLSDNEGSVLPLHSPRHRFLQLLIKDAKCAPLPIIIRHHPDDDELNLAHRTLGDDYIIYLSAVVQDLPNLTKLNLRDNRLTDRGMGKFIHTLANQQQIQSVDISENKIDSKSAEALTHFLKRRDCTLKVLKMSNADLDDDEVAIFMDALQMNQSLLEIDISHNKLGGTGERSVHNKKENLTGGAAVAAALGANTTLQSIDLSWNKLGLLSAVSLEQALAINHTLLNLNLSYNTMRDEGAEAIGNSLPHNHALTSLDLSHNSIGSIGVFVIATGLKQNSHLRILNISGNPIGSYGGQALLKTLNYQSVEREILLNNCSFDSEALTSNKINLIYPTGKKSLDLSRPRNRCAMLELFHLASIKRGCSIKNIEYQPTGSNKSSRKKVIIKLIRPNNPAQYLGQPYGPWTKSTARERHPYTLLTGDEWMKIERNLFLLDASTGKIWEIPNSGIISFDFFYFPRCATPIECLNLTGLTRLKQLLITHPKEFMNILKLCQHLVLETYQIIEIITALEEVGRAKEKIEYLAYLMLCVRDTSNTSTLLFTKYVDELTQLRNLHSIMKSMFYVSVNAFSGHYSLDLDNPMDRLAGIRLMEISDHENAYLYRVMPTWSANSPPSTSISTSTTAGAGGGGGGGYFHGFTSQKNNRTNFRNEYYRRMPVEKGCNDEFFSFGLEDKSHGILEFDFVSISRPSLHVQPLSDDYLEYLLSSRGLLNASAAPIQNPKRRRKSRQHHSSTSSVSSGTGTGTGEGAGQGRDNDEESNPFTMVYKRLPLHQRLTSFDEENEEKEIDSSDTTATSSATNPSATFQPRHASSLHIDPSRVLGHYVVKKESRILPLDLPISPENLHYYLMNNSKQSQQYFNDIREDDLNTLSHELNHDLSMYYLDKTLDRYIINLSIRIISKNHDNFFELISFIRRLGDSNSHEAYGHGKADEADKPTKSSFLLEVLGLTNELSNFEIGLTHYSNTSHLNPTHRKYILNDEIHILGNEIFVRLKCIDWTLHGIQDRAREVCAKLFSCIGVSKSNIRIANHRTCDTKYSEFSYPKFTLPVTTHLVLQQLDVIIEGLPIDSSVLLKTYVYNGRLGDDPISGTAINTVWRWRVRYPIDRGAPRLDLNTFPNEFWGYKFLHLRALFGSLWITARQAAHIVNEFPQFGYDGQPHRETAILSIWNRIIDLENFYLVLQTLHATNHHTVYDRIGWQNVLNMNRVDRLFVLDLSLDDARNMAIMLAKVAQVEPGENFIEPKFRRTMGDLYIPGWSLPTSWTIDPEKAKVWDGVPRKGQIAVTYISTGHGRAVVPSIRKYFHEKYSLLSVPRDEGNDFYLTDADPKLWDG